MIERFRGARTLAEMNLREFVRDYVAAFFTFAFPIVFAVLFGIQSTNQRSPDLKVGLVQQAPGDQRAQAFTRSLRQVPTIKVNQLKTIGDASSFLMGRTVNSGKGLSAVVVVSQSRGGVVGVRTIAAPSTAGTVRTAVEAARGASSAARAERPEYALTFAKPPGQRTDKFSFVMPGLVAVALLQLGLFATALPLLNARVKGTLRHLSLTPVTGTALLSAQVGFRMALAVLQVTLLFLVAGWMGLNVAGSWLMLGGLVVLGAVMFIAIGYAIAGLVPSRETGTVVILIANFAMVFLGGVFYEVGGGAFEVISRCLPITYLADGLRQVVLGTDGALPIGVDIAALAGFTVVVMGLALRTFRYSTAPA
jgi:ABC-2 type transport system permease protein